MKRILRILLIFIFCFPLTIHAEEEEGSDTNSTTSPEDTETDTAQENDNPLSLTAKSAVLIDENSGTVLLDYNKDQEWDPASLTKLMTIYLSSEVLDVNQELTMSSDAYETYNHYKGVLWIQQEETLTVLDCMYAAMLVSANDPTAMLAEAAGVNNEGMVSRMNTKAQEIGMGHTNFDNVFGTNSESNYSSAYDIALLIQQARKNKVFKEIFGASSYTIEPTNLQTQPRVLGNDCGFLRESDSHYNANVTGAKIGSTDEGGYALGVSASKGDTNYIAVVLGESDAESAYSDIQKLLDYGFENVETVTISTSDIGTKIVEVYSNKRHIADVEFYADSSFSLLLSSDVTKDQIGYEIQVENEDSNDPDEIQASVVFTLNGSVIGSSELEKKITTIENTMGLENTATDFQTILDYASIAVFAFILFFRYIVKFLDSLNPTK